MAAREEIHEAWKSTFEELKLSPTTLSPNEGKAAIEAATLMFDRFGIASSPTIFVNGRLLEFSEQGWPRDVVKLYQDEIYRLQMLLHNGDLTDDKIDYYAQLMDDPRVARSRHPEIDPMRKGVYLSELPDWAVDKGGKNVWTYSSKATDNCAYSVTLKLHPRDADHLITWLQMAETTERKLRLRIQVEETISGDKELLTIFGDLAENHISTREAISRLQALRDSIQEDPTRPPPLVIVNGKIYGPFIQPLSPADAESLLLLEWNLRTERLQLIRLAQGLERTPGALTAMTLFEGHLRSLLGNRFAYLFTGTHAFELPVEKLNHFKIENSRALLKITTMIDPLSMTGAKIGASLLQARGLIEAIVILNNRHPYHERDLQFLYRFTCPTSLDPLLPGTQYSLQLLTPPAWSVLPRDTDLDHLVYKPEDGQKIEILIDGLVLEVDVMLNGRGQSGLPLTLSTDEQISTIVDQAVTITTKGYAQLSAPPGIYKVQPPTIEGLNMSPVRAVLSSMGINKLILTGTTKDSLRSIRLESLLREENEETHILFTPETSQDMAQLMRTIPKHEVASPSSTHFWILANLLPLSTRILIRRQLQERAAVTLFTYRWPAWLVAPSGKGNRLRILKTLFLDALPRRVRGNLILIPNDCKNVLWNGLSKLDLDGHVWAMTPYCNATAGYWRTAEWTRFLTGKPYHAVSQEAILIDAARFRERAVGERLRTEYHRQSYDIRRLLPRPDEILINRLVHDVPILSREGCVSGDEILIKEHEDL